VLDNFCKGKKIKNKNFGTKIKEEKKFILHKIKMFKVSFDATAIRSRAKKNT
jgi:hypothetical protein